MVIFEKFEPKNYDSKEDCHTRNSKRTYPSIKQNKIEDFVDNQLLSQTSSYSYQKCSKKEKKRTK